MATFGILLNGRCAYERQALTYALFLFCMLFTWLRFSCRHSFNMQFSLLLAVVATHWQLCISTLPNTPPGPRSRQATSQQRTFSSFLSFYAQIQVDLHRFFFELFRFPTKANPSPRPSNTDISTNEQTFLDSISRRLHTSHHR